MRRTLAIAALTLVVAVTSAAAVSSYTYGEDEYVTIANGSSPSGTYAIAAHGVGEDASLAFGLYLMAGSTGKMLDPLDEIDDHFETAPNAYTASWSPDEKYVALSYRVDRHVVGVRLFQIAGNEGRPVELPSLVEEWRTANLGKDYANVSIPSLVASLEWRSADRIVLREEGVLKSDTEGGAIEGPLARLGKLQQSEDDGQIMADFTLEAEGKLTAAGTLEITVPGHAVRAP